MKCPARILMIGAAVTFSGLAGACGLVTSGDCVSIGRAGLSVLVRDSVTGGPGPDGTRVIASEGAFADTALGGFAEPDGTLFSLLVERPGVYDVLVEAPGYRPWQRSGVAVTRDMGHCSPLRTTGVVALIQR